MRKKHEFHSTGRYHWDLRYSVKDGWAQIDTWQDAYYYGTWANPITLTVFAYVEGDCYTTECDNEYEFCLEIMEIKRWNDSSGGERGFLGIDAGLSPENIKKWKEIGLGHLLH